MGYISDSVLDTNDIHVFYLSFPVFITHLSKLSENSLMSSPLPSGSCDLDLRNLIKWPRLAPDRI